MSIGQLLPIDLIQRLLAIPTSALGSVPLGPAWLLVKAPVDDGEVDLVPALIHSLEHVGGAEGEAAASTMEMPAIQLALASEEGADQVHLIAELNSIRHVAVPLLFRLDQRLVLGRSESAHIRVMDPSVSGKHAAFGWNDGALTVTDLGSKNGTMHNETPLLPRTSTWLQPMDRLKFGRVEGFICDPRALRAVLLQERRAAGARALAPSSDQP
jgi:hypothetical protein